VLFGESIWRQIAGAVVADFGCGVGEEAIEMAQKGAARVIGIDILEHSLQAARRAAQDAGVAERCQFVTRTDEPVDCVVSLDGFEHFNDPEEVLRAAFFWPSAPPGSTPSEAISSRCSPGPI
jgi:2-polyprenyl-3-methyl-5-hydroxy-6-metoxy-1,4-benzoquinol methylase